MIIFGTWLVQQAGRNDPIGDLSKDFVEDCRLNKLSTAMSRRRVEARIAYSNAHMNANDTLSEAYREFINLPK